MLIKNIFSKNSAWVLGLAAAAIFAVTFVACDNGSTSTEYVNVVKVQLAGVGPFAAVRWVDAVSGDSTWVVADKDGLVDAPSSGWYLTPAGGNIIAKSSMVAGPIVSVPAETTTLYEIMVIKASGVTTKYALGSALADATPAEEGTSYYNVDSIVGATTIADNASEGTKLYAITVWTATSKTVKYALGSATATATPATAGTLYFKDAGTTVVTSISDDGTDLFPVTVYTATSKTTKYVLGSGLSAACGTVTGTWYVKGVGLTVAAGPIADTPAETTTLYPIDVYTATAKTTKYALGSATAAATAATSGTWYVKGVGVTVAASLTAESAANATNVYPITVYTATDYTTKYAYGSDLATAAPAASGTYYVKDGATTTVKHF